MGAKSSRVQAVTVGSTEKVIHAPASEVSASAPPTPEHPDGAPRGEENAQVDNYFPMPMPMPGQVDEEVLDASRSSGGGGGSLASSGGGAQSKTNASSLGRRPSGSHFDTDSGKQHQWKTHTGTQSWPHDKDGGAKKVTSAAKGSPTKAAGAGAGAAGAAGASSSSSSSTSPLGKAASATDPFDFSVPHDKVLQLAVEAFGHGASNFSSTKWDMRVQALKSMGSVLKSLDISSAMSAANQSAAAGATAIVPGGQRPAPAATAAAASGGGGKGGGGGGGGGGGLQLRDEANCFRAACLVLNIALREKVLPVLLEAYSFLRITLEHGAGKVSVEEASFAIATLLDHPLGKLGDMNIRLHEQACATFVHCCGRTPRLPVRAALEKLANFLENSRVRGPQRMRLHAGVLDCIGQLARRFPGRQEGDLEDDVDEEEDLAAERGRGSGSGGGAAASNSNDDNNNNNNNNTSTNDAPATWSAEDLRPFVAAAAVVDPVLGARVHQAAATLSVTIYTTLGRRGLSVAAAETPGEFKELVLNKIEEETGMRPAGLEDDDADNDNGYGAPEDGDNDMADEEGDEVPGLDLCITGVALSNNKAPKVKEQSWPTDMKEESLMDEILESTGMVFQGRGLQAEVSSPQEEEEEEEEEAPHELDEELRQLGLVEPGVVM